MKQKRARGARQTDTKRSDTSPSGSLPTTVGSTRPPPSEKIEPDRRPVEDSLTTLETIGPTMAGLTASGKHA
jgi:hypothetical protein